MDKPVLAGSSRTQIYHKSRTSNTGAGTASATEANAVVVPTANDCI